MKKILLFRLVLVSMLLSLMISGCCEKVEVIKKVYIPCPKVEVLDLNYTNDTNYSIESIEYEVM